MKPTDYIFPSIGVNGIAQVGNHISVDVVQHWIAESVKGAGISCTGGKFSTHCFRHGGAQYCFMYAPLGEHWTFVRQQLNYIFK